MFALVVPKKKTNAVASRPVGPTMTTHHDSRRGAAPLQKVAGEGVRRGLTRAQVLEDQSRRGRCAAFLQSELSGAAAVERAARAPSRTWQRSGGDRPGSVATAWRRSLVTAKPAARLTASASAEHGAVISGMGEADASELPQGTVGGPPPSRGTFARLTADGLKLGDPVRPSHRDLDRVRCAMACRRTDGSGSMRTYDATEEDAFSSDRTSGSLAEETDEEDGESAIHCSAEHGVAEWPCRLLAADAGAGARDEAGRTPLELVEALWDAKGVDAALAAHHMFKQQEATIASLRAELEQAKAEKKLAVNCLNLMSVSNYRGVLV